jgi:hypothetical protein
VTHSQAAVQKSLQRAQAAAVAALQVPAFVHLLKTKNSIQTCSVIHFKKRVCQPTHPNLHYASSRGKLGGDPGVAQDSTSGMGVHPTQLAHLHMAQFVAARLSELGV